MIEFYLGCLIVGVTLAVLTFLFGDVLDGVIDGGLEFLHFDFFKPIVVVSAVTVFGGSGYLIEKYTTYSMISVLIISIIFAILVGIFTVFAFVKPMKKTESSNAYSMKELEGKIAEIITPIPAKGYGEVLLKLGAGVVNHTAASYDKVEIGRGEKVVVVAVEDHVLYVSKMDLSI